MEYINKILDLLQYNPKEPLLFNTGLFLFLFLFVALGYFALRKKLTARLVFVTLFSYYFYYKSSGAYFCLLAVVTISDWLIAKRIALPFVSKDNSNSEAESTGEDESKRGNRWWLLLSLVVWN